MKKRCFIAIPLSPDLQKAIAPLCSSLPSSLAVCEEYRHITVQFLGSIDNHREQALIEKLAWMRIRPFSVRIVSSGMFAQKRNRTTLWLGVEDDNNENAEDRAGVSDTPKTESGSLHRLHRSVVDLCRAVHVPDSLPLQNRKYRPHITVARLKRKEHFEQYGRHWLAATALFKSGVYPVESLALYQSRLLPQGAEYRVIRLFPFCDV